MRATLPLLLVSAFLLTIPAHAEEEGDPLTFSGASAVRKIAVPTTARIGDLLWESGPSDPIPSDFDKLLFQGVLSHPGVSFEASAKGPDGWGLWVKAEVERFPNGRFWARFPIAGKKGAVVRVRVVHKGIARSGAVELYGFETNPLPKAGPPTPARPVPATELPVSTDAVKPDVFPRESWKSLPAAQPYEPMVPNRITLHHTEAAQPIAEKDAIQEMQIIQQYHQKGRGWIDIGYHFLIDGSGRVWQGRPETVIGAHVRNKNDGNVGISLMGSFHPPKNNEPTPEQLRSFILLARWLTGAYTIPPGTLLGHRDQQATSCPGDILYAKLDSLREAVVSPVPPAASRIPEAALGEIARPLPNIRLPDHPAFAVLMSGTSSEADKMRALKELFDSGQPGGR